MSNINPLLTVAEAAAYLRRSESYVRRMVRERRITFYRVGRFVRFRPADLDAHLAEGRMPALGRVGPSQAAQDRPGSNVGGRA